MPTTRPLACPPSQLIGSLLDPRTLKPRDYSPKIPTDLTTDRMLISLIVPLFSLTPSISAARMKLYKALLMECPSTTLKTMDLGFVLTNCFVRDVVDVFTVLPHHLAEGLVARYNFKCHCSRLLGNKDHTADVVLQANGTKDDELENQAMAYRSIRRKHLDQVTRPLSNRKNDWKDAKAAMG